MVANSSKDFNLNKRLFFLFREYDRLIKIWNTLCTSIIKDESNNYSTQYYKNKIIPIIIESSKEQGIYYECLSEEILRMYKRTEKVNSEICFKLASDGWAGNIFCLGKTSELCILGETILEFYDSALGGEGLNANLWISDEVYKYCYWSEIGGSMSFLNPIYEDFMLLDLK